MRQPCSKESHWLKSPLGCTARHIWKGVSKNSNLSLKNNDCSAFKSCKVFETALQFSEWDKMCWHSITTEQVEELPLQDPNPNYICREKKNQNQYCGNSQNVTAESCEHMHSSDVLAAVSGLCRERNRPKKSQLVCFESQHVCIEFRLYASHKGLQSKQILQKTVEWKQGKIIKNNRGPKCKQYYFTFL